MNEEWTRFLGGKWQKDMPKQSGRFPVKAFAGEGKTEESYSFAIVFEDQVTHEHRSVHSWGGLWWSEPIPDELPREP